MNKKGNKWRLCPYTIFTADSQFESFIMPTSAVVWGCTAAVVSSAIQSLGITLQRKSHVIPYNHELGESSVINVRRESAFGLELESRPHHFKRNMWIIGFLMFIVANILGSLVQLTTLPLIILSPLQSIGLIFNSILSCMLLPGEHFTKRLGFGTLIIAVGAYIIAYNGAAEAPPQDIDTDQRFHIIVEKLRRPGFLTWWIFTFVAMLVLVRVNMELSKRVKALNLSVRKRRNSRNGSDAVSRYTFAKGILYGIISGTLTAHTFLFAKSIVDVLVETVLERGKPKSLATYVTTVLLLLATLSIVAMQLVAFNLGLSHILTSILYPLCFLVFNLVNLFNDVLFNMLLSKGTMTVCQLMWVIFGLCGVLIGVIMISWDSAFTRVSKEGEPLMSCKFPYDQIPARVLLYEEAELLGVLQIT